MHKILLNTFNIMFILLCYLKFNNCFIVNKIKITMDCECTLFNSDVIYCINMLLLLYYCVKMVAPHSRI